MDSQKESGNREGFEELVKQAAEACGIIEGYYDIWGKHHPTSVETKIEILRAMGVDVRSSESLLKFARSKDPCFRRRNNGLSVVGAENQAIVVEAKVDGSAGSIKNTKIEAVFNPPLHEGVHDLRIELKSGSARSGASQKIFVVPDKGYEPEAISAGARLWGVNIPLYGVKSSRNWGIGDFADLKIAVQWASSLGADFVGLLPLHALFNELPYGISPYFPSSRLFLNPIHIAMDEVVEASAPEVRKLMEQPDFQKDVFRVRSSELVDHSGVWTLKHKILKACFNVFAGVHHAFSKGLTDRGRQFDKWRKKQGEALERFATFCALREYLSDEFGKPRPWRNWPKEHQSPDGEGVKQFRAEHPEKITFHAYMQWVAETQLLQAQDLTRQFGMAIGLYLDMALGVDSCGADAWVYQDVLALGASAGAPPDPFSLLGQRWGLPPAIPSKHRAKGYSFFLETLQRSAARAGALRIDHILGLWRLFWIPGKLPASKGAYVTENTEELLGLMRLVSRESQCLIVGEDLGTIPDGVREDLLKSGFFSYRLLIFEKDWDGRYKKPYDYPKRSLISIATHDLPTLDGFWLGRDLEVKKALNRYPDEKTEKEDEEGRKKDRLMLLEAIKGEGLLPVEIDLVKEIPASKLTALAVAAHAFLARSPSALMLANLDDMLGEIEMQNLPGTIDEHPNWRRKCSIAIEKWQKSKRAKQIAEAILAEGRGACKPPTLT